MTIKKITFAIVFLSGLALSGGISRAATITWTAGGAGTWASSTNWTPAVVPTSTDVVIFSGSSTQNCTINTPAIVTGITITSAYSGTIIQGPGQAITVGSSGYSQASGTFSGASSPITINGPFTLGAGSTFQSTSNKLTLDASSTFSGTFQNNSSTVVFNATSSGATITGSLTLYNLQFGDGTGGNNILTIPAGTVLTAQNYLYMDTNSTAIQLLGGGQVKVNGNIEAGYLPTYATGTVGIFVNGSSSQIIGDDSVANHGAGDSLFLPSLTVSNSGTVAYVEGTVVITGSSTISQGELGLATGTSPTSFEVDGTLTIGFSGVLSDYPVTTSTIKLGSSVSNSGLVWFDGGGQGCPVTTPNYVVINSTTTGQQVPWSVGGLGNFVMRYVSVKDQTGTASISDINGSFSNVGGGWNLITGAPEIQLVQTSTAQGINSPLQVNQSFNFRPRAGDLILVAISGKGIGLVISAPTDTYNNTYQLIASTTFADLYHNLSLYYARDIMSGGGNFIIGTGGTATSGNISLSIAVYDYTGVAPSSTFDTSSVNDGTITTSTPTYTSLSANGSSPNELYFGIASNINTTTPVTSTPGWAQEAGFYYPQAGTPLYAEDFSTSTIISTSAQWTAVTSTQYAAIIGIFRAPYRELYQPSGSLDSQTFDTGVASGSQINSILWQGTAPANSKVEFQFAGSSSSSGPWTYYGPGGSTATYYGPATPGVLQSVDYNLFSGSRFFRYRIYLFADTTYQYTPTVNQVTVNWSP